MATASEKDSRDSTIENPAAQMVSESEDAVLSADMDSLPPGYFTSTFFLGTMLASGLAKAAVQ